MQQYDTIFFVDSMNSIKTILSMNMPLNKVLFIISEDSKSLHQLLIEIVPDPKVVLIPVISFFGFYKTSRDNYLKLLKFKQYLTNLLEYVHTLSIVYVNFDIIKPNLITALSVFIDKIQVVAISQRKISPQKYIENQNLPAQSCWHLNEISQILGFKVYAIDTFNTISIGFGPKTKEKISFKSILTKNWDDLLSFGELNIQVDKNGHPSYSS